MSDQLPLRDYLISNGVDVAQLFALLTNFSEKMVINHEDADLWEKHLTWEGINHFIGEIDPKK